MRSCHWASVLSGSLLLPLLLLLGRRQHHGGHDFNWTRTDCFYIDLLFALFKQKRVTRYLRIVRQEIKRRRIITNFIGFNIYVMFCQVLSDRYMLDFL